MAETSNPISCNIPSLSAAVNPIKDQITGIMISHLFILASINNNKPIVNIVVGQGKPNVGKRG